MRPKFANGLFTDPSPEFKDPIEECAPSKVAIEEISSNSAQRIRLNSSYAFRTDTTAEQTNSDLTDVRAEKIGNNEVPIVISHMSSYSNLGFAPLQGKIVRFGLR